MDGKEKRLSEFTEKQQYMSGTGSKIEELGSNPDCKIVNKLVDVIIKDMEKRKGKIQTS